VNIKSLNSEKILNIMKENYNAIIAMGIIVFVILLIMNGGKGIAIPIVILMLIGKFFLYRHDMVPEKKVQSAYKKIRDIIEKNRDELEKIELYTIDNIGREYKALGMVESTEASKDDGKIALQLQAFRLEADAIVNIVSSTTATTQGDIKADTILSPGGGGNIRTSVMYHYEGTAIKYI